MKVVIIYENEFPGSGATTEHIMSYSKGLVKLGHEVWVLPLQPYIDKKNPPQQLPQIQGIYEGIHYLYPANTIYWPHRRSAILTKVFLKFKSYWGVYRFLQSNKVDALLHVFPNEITYGLCKWICKLSHYPFVVEKTELPKIYKNEAYYNSTYFRRIFKIYIENVFAYPDAWIVETKTLQNYYQKFSKPDASFHILPMTVEVERFSNLKKNQHSENYIAYCGNMREDDGLSILINAFKLIADKYPDYKLKLAGNSDDTPKQKELVKQLNIEDRVVFSGRMDRELIPEFLGNARLLVLASPTSLRSCATMPCKVGEYLCTEVPVVVTALGEINNYLIDRENAYLAQPDSAEKFAQKMDDALSDSEERKKKIVENGRKTALKYFSADSQAITMSHIFERIFNTSSKV